MIEHVASVNLKTTFWACACGFCSDGLRRRATRERNADSKRMRESGRSILTISLLPFELLRTFISMASIRWAYASMTTMSIVYRNRFEGTLYHPWWDPFVVFSEDDVVMTVVLIFNAEFLQVFLCPVWGWGVELVGIRGWIVRTRLVVWCWSGWRVGFLWVGGNEGDEEAEYTSIPND